MKPENIQLVRLALPKLKHIRIPLACLFILLSIHACRKAESSTNTNVKQLDVTNHVGATFLSDTDPAYRLLEKRQQIIYERNTNLFRWTGSTDQINEFSNLCVLLDNRSNSLTRSYSSLETNILLQLNHSMPTRYEDPNSFWIIQNDFDDIILYAGPYLRLKENPKFGTLPLGTLNATQVRIPNSEESLILINSGLFSFCHEMIKLGLETILITNAAGDKVEIDFSQDYFNAGPRKDVNLKVRLSKALEDFANGRPIRGQARPEALHDPILSRIVHAMEIFVISHELGHIVLGHTNISSEDLYLPGNPGGLPLKAISRTWGQEAAADVFGQMLLSRVIDGMQTNEEVNVGVENDLVGCQKAAPIIFFALAQICDEAKFINEHHALPPTYSEADKTKIMEILAKSLATQLQTNSTNEGSSNINTLDADLLKDLNDHPPDWARRLLAEKFLEESSAKFNDDQMAFTRLALQMVFNLETMWEDIKPLWVQISQENDTNNVQVFGKTPLPR